MGHSGVQMYPKNVFIQPRDTTLQWHLLNTVAFTVLLSELHSFLGEARGIATHQFPWAG